ncbi:hypothetical protein [Pajaroellobacter abortibovis]|uniref:hypothetical protein n=1 Tax=Pajaroellobacter abortibovis TaxID=1882918 RepID=UPI0012EB63E2|nr:hypothetical protein [Pajaroellobacter abortibovis]
MLHWKGAYQSDRSETASLGMHELPSSQEARILTWNKEEENAGLGEGTIKSKSTLHPTPRKVH